ncbi:cell division protein FtsK [Streptococcus suis]|uniref:cell division protein FtsK n=1 Tax=Streptococcus suis TaxID=1307 RepID=UPI002FCC333B
MAFSFSIPSAEREFVDTEYLTQCVEIGLGNSSISATTNSFQFIYGDNYLDFIPRFPCAYILDNHLYQHIFQILSTSAYPMLTFLKQPSAYIVKRDSQTINTSRAFRFPFFKGIPERLIYQKLSDIRVQNERFELMKNYQIDFNRIVHCLIAGSSGSGKSYALTYLISVIQQFAHVIVVDPKCDSITRYCLKHKLSVLYQERDFSADEFVSKVNGLLKTELDTIYQRQAELLENPSKKFQHRCLIIDELLALTSLTSKNVKDTFFALLSNIALLGRATSIHLILVSQRMDTNALPIAVREQCNLLIQLGLINRKTTTFLFPDLESETGLVIPNGKGTGIVQVIDGITVPNVMPLLIPTITEEMI